MPATANRKTATAEGSYGAYVFDIATGEIVSRESAGDYSHVARVAVPETIELLAVAGVTLEAGEHYGAQNLCTYGPRGGFREGSVWIEAEDKWRNRRRRVVG